MPPLVRVLGCNPVTSTTLLACLTTADVNSLRRLHPTVVARWLWMWAIMLLRWRPCQIAASLSVALTGPAWVCTVCSRRHQQRSDVAL